jgi:Mrp family chromosome partitioning ATPase
MGAESFAELRNALLTGLGDEPATLVIATPSPGNGADVVAANLAITLARAGHSTTIVVADEESEIPVLLGLTATEGLTEVLRGRVELTSVLQRWPDLPALRVLPAGHGLHSEVADLEGSGVSELLESLTERSHYVIVRARPSDGAADAQYFGRYANAAIPVIEIGRTVREAVAAGVRQWKLVGTVVPGAVTVPAFEAPQPPPPRAVTSPSGETGPEPRPALTPKDSDQFKPSSPSGSSPPGSSPSGLSPSASSPSGSSPSGSSPSGGHGDPRRPQRDRTEDLTDEPLRKAPPQR